MGLLQNLVELSNDPSCFFREKQVSAWVIQYIFSICSKAFFEKYTLPTTTEELRSIADSGKVAPRIYPGARGSPGETSPGWHFAFTIQDLSCRHKRRQRVVWVKPPPRTADRKKTIKARQRRAATSRFSLLTCLRYLLQILSDLKTPLLRSAKGAFSTVTPWVAVSNYLSQLIADDLLIFTEWFLQLPLFFRKKKVDAGVQGTA